MKSARCNISLYEFISQECGSCSEVEIPISRRLRDHQVEATSHGLLTWFAEDRLKIIKMNATGDPVVIVTIFGDLVWQLSVAGVRVYGDFFFSSSVSSSLKVEDCLKLSSVISMKEVC